MQNYGSEHAGVDYEAMLQDPDVVHAVQNYISENKRSAPGSPASRGSKPPSPSALNSSGIARDAAAAFPQDYYGKYSVPAAEGGDLPAAETAAPAEPQGYEAGGDMPQPPPEYGASYNNDFGVPLPGPWAHHAQPEGEGGNGGWSGFGDADFEGGGGAVPDFEGGGDAPHSRSLAPEPTFALHAEAELEVQQQQQYGVDEDGGVQYTEHYSEQYHAEYQAYGQAQPPARQDRELAGGDAGGASAVQQEDPTLGQVLGSFFRPQMTQLAQHLAGGAAQSGAENGRSGSGTEGALGSFVTSVGGTLKDIIMGDFDGPGAAQPPGKPGKLAAAMPWEESPHPDAPGGIGGGFLSNGHLPGEGDGFVTPAAGPSPARPTRIPHPPLPPGADSNAHGTSEEGAPVFSPGQLAADLGVPRAAVSVAALFARESRGSVGTLSSRSSQDGWSQDGWGGQEDLPTEAAAPAAPEVPPQTAEDDLQVPEAALPPEVQPPEQEFALPMHPVAPEVMLEEQQQLPVSAKDGWEEPPAVAEQWGTAAIQAEGSASFDMGAATAYQMAPNLPMDDSTPFTVIEAAPEVAELPSAVARVQEQVPPPAPIPAVPEMATTGGEDGWGWGAEEGGWGDQMPEIHDMPAAPAMVDDKEAYSAAQPVAAAGAAAEVAAMAEELAAMRARAEAAEATAAEAQAQVQALQEKAAAYAQQLDAAQAQMAESHASLSAQVETLTGSNAALLDEKAAFEARCAALEAAATEKASSTEEFEARIASLQAERDGLVASLAEKDAAAAESAAAAGNAAVLQMELEDAKEALERSENECDDLRSMLELKDDAVQALKAQVAQLESDLQAARSELAAVGDSAARAVQDAVAAKDAELAQVQHTLAAKEEELSAALAAANGTSAEVGTLEAALAAKEVQLAGISEQMSAMVAELTAAQQGQSRLAEQISTLEAHLQVRGTLSRTGRLVFSLACAPSSISPRHVLSGCTICITLLWMCFACLQAALEEKDAEIMQLEARAMTAEATAQAAAQLEAAFAAKDAELEALQGRIKELEKKFTLAKKKIAAQQAQQAQHEQATAEVEALRSRLAEAESALNNAAAGKDAELQELSAALEEAQHAQHDLLANISALQARLAEAEAAHGARSAEIESLAADNAKLAEMLAEREDHGERMVAEIAQLRSQLETHAASGASAAELAKARDEIAQWMAVAEDADARCTAAEEELEAERAEREATAAAAAQVQEQLASLQAVLQSTEAQLAELEAVQEAATAAIEAADAQEREVVAMQQRLAQADAELEALRAGAVQGRGTSSMTGKDEEMYQEEIAELHAQLQAASEAAAQKEEEMRKYKLQLVKAKKVRAADQEKISSLETAIASGGAAVPPAPASEPATPPPPSLQEELAALRQQLEAVEGELAGVRAAAQDAEEGLTESLSALGQEEAKVARLAELLVASGMPESAVEEELAAVEELLGFGEGSEGQEGEEESLV